MYVTPAVIASFDATELLGNAYGDDHFVPQGSVHESHSHDE